MKIEKIKKLSKRITDNSLIQSLTEFIEVFENQAGLAIRTYSQKQENGYEVKLKLGTIESFGDGHAGSHVSYFTLKEISFFIPLDLSKLKNAYNKLNDFDKVPPSYSINNPLENELFIETIIIEELDSCLLNLEKFSGKNDNYSEIAKLFNKRRGSFKGKLNGV